jgi:hypothetical protein
VRAAVLEDDPGAGDEILDCARGQHLPRLCKGATRAPVWTAMPGDLAIE